MIDNTNISLQSALVDLELGHYIRATSSLIALRNVHDSIDAASAYHSINIELIRAHILRGSFVSASEAIDESLAKFPASFLEDLETRQPCGIELDKSCVYLVLRMQKAFVASLIDGSLDGSLKIGMRIVKLLPPYTRHEVSLYSREIASLFTFS